MEKSSKAPREKARREPTEQRGAEPTSDHHRHQPASSEARSVPVDLAWSPIIERGTSERGHQFRSKLPGRSRAKLPGRSRAKLPGRSRSKFPRRGPGEGLLSRGNVRQSETP